LAQIAEEEEVTAPHNGRVGPAQSSKKSAPGRPFPKGHSGNPGGRPKSLTEAVKAKVGDDGQKLIDGLYAIAFETPKELKERFGFDVKVGTKERIAAINGLLDRGWGKATQTHDVNTNFDPAKYLAREEAAE
jgi:hypothetical protein